MSFIFLLLPFIEHKIFDHNSEYYWEIIFLAVALARYRCNRQGLIFGVTVIGTLAIGYSYEPWSFSVLLMFQMTVATVDLFCSIFYIKFYRGINADPVFVILEPMLIIVMASYFIDSAPATTMMTVLHKWVGVYLVMQFFYASWRLAGLYRPVTVWTRFVPVPPHEVILRNLRDELEDIIRPLTRGAVPFRNTGTKHNNKKQRRNHVQEKRQ